MVVQNVEAIACTEEFRACLSPMDRQVLAAAALRW